MIICLLPNSYNLNGCILFLPRSLHYKKYPLLSSYGSYRPRLCNYNCRANTGRCHPDLHFAWFTSVNLPKPILEIILNQLWIRTGGTLRPLSDQSDYSVACRALSPISSTPCLTLYQAEDVASLVFSQALSLMSLVFSQACCMLWLVVSHQS